MNGTEARLVVADRVIEVAVLRITNAERPSSYAIRLGPALSCASAPRRSAA